MKNLSVKKRIIKEIQTLERGIDNTASGFIYLNRMNIENLQILRDELKIESQWDMEARRYISEIGASC